MPGRRDRTVVTKLFRSRQLESITSIHLQSSIERLGDVADSGSDGQVEELVADQDLETREDGRVDLGANFDLLSSSDILGNRLLHGLQLRLLQLLGGDDGDVHNSALGLHQLCEERKSIQRQSPSTTMVGDEKTYRRSPRRSSATRRVCRWRTAPGTGCG